MVFPSFHVVFFSEDCFSLRRRISVRNKKRSTDYRDSFTAHGRMSRFEPRDNITETTHCFSTNRPREIMNVFKFAAPDSKTVETVRHFYDVQNMPRAYFNESATPRAFRLRILCENGRFEHATIARYRCRLSSTELISVRFSVGPRDDTKSKNNKFVGVQNLCLFEKQNRSSYLRPTDRHRRTDNGCLFRTYGRRNSSSSGCDERRK